MSQELLRNLSRRERQIMDILYARGPSAVGEILGQLSDPPSYSAVRATLRVLEEKGYVEHEQAGPRYLYRPTVARDKARSAALSHVVRTFFNGSAAQAAAALLQLSDTRMKPDELERLAREVERARKEGR